MGRKNRRNKREYYTGLNFNPRKYVTPTATHKTHLTRIPKRGDIWFANLGSHPGTSVQGGCRPVVIVSNDIGNYHAETLNVLPVTRHMKKPDLPCHTEIDPAFISDLHQSFDLSMILAEQITTIDKSQLRNYVGRIEDEGILNRISTSINGQLGLSSLSQHAEITEETENNNVTYTEEGNIYAE